MGPYICAYLVCINVLAFMVYGADKWKARHDRWRIRESILLLWAVLGGSIGALTAMQLLRHKTKHKKFTLGVPVILILQILGFIVWYTGLIR